MPKRIPLVSIGVTRDGKTFNPPVGTETTGEPFDFTAAEIDDINRMEKSSGQRLIRKLISEGDEGDLATSAAVGKPLSAMNLEELKAEAAARNLELGAATTKAEIRGVIEAAEAEDL